MQDRQWIEKLDSLNEGIAQSSPVQWCEWTLSNEIGSWGEVALVLSNAVTVVASRFGGVVNVNSNKSKSIRLFSKKLLILILSCTRQHSQYDKFILIPNLLYSHHMLPLQYQSNQIQ